MKISIIIVIFLSLPRFSPAQKNILVKTIDSAQSAPGCPETGAFKNSKPSFDADTTGLSLHNYFLLLGSDFKQQVRLPFQLKRKDWKSVAAFATLTAAVSLADEPISRYAVKLKNANNGVSVLSRYVTRLGGPYEVFALTGMAAYGIILRDQKLKTTALLATQAYITAGAVETALKFLTARQRPFYIDKIENENEPYFHGPLFHFRPESNANSRSSSFPSGHTTVAFAAATVFAMAYRQNPIIPILSYSTATLIGLSRLTENKHWPTDILAGAALGFLSGRQVVKNYHRFSKTKQVRKNSEARLSFNLQYFYGRILPGAVYHL